MSDTNGRLDYSRLVSDIDFANAFEGTRFEHYTSREEGLGSILGGWIGAIIGRFVGMALGRVAQELLIDELFGTEEDNGTDGEQAADEQADSEQAADEDDTEDTDTDTEGETADSASTEDTDEETAEADAE